MSNDRYSNLTHYEILGVSKDASHDEIKRTFRRLSLKFHPDLNKEHSCGEKFKVIANAHTVLANPEERKTYDRQLMEDIIWRGGTEYRRGGVKGFSGADRRYRRPLKPTGHVVMETLTNPRFFMLGLIGFGGVAVLGSILGGVSSKRPEYQSYEPLVEAWKNPLTGRYEQPAPWDKEYQRMKPKLELVPREKVWKRHR
mmetsp:Transcript_24267/g.67211  ORF Transcript_24267/g.67211 Transcript_24267/m.67211 type:complete len:198 (+) Transcript_24267:114-707(+)